MAMFNLSRSSSFPSTFIFGVASSSIQIEGATSEGGRGKGIWDTFASSPGTIADGSTPAITCDHFHRFKEDILEVKRLGLDAYRLSISWPRLFPETSDKLNQEGVGYYNDVINCIVEAGLIPFVTLYHWDLPQFLQDDPDVKGWSTKNIIKHFLIFVNTCFKCFGDRVKNWITFNEIHLSTVLAYEVGIMAPGRASDASTNPYTVAHHQLLSHAATVKLYRADYQKEQEGSIGISTDIMCYEPMSETQEDIDAAAISREFEMGWILDPVQFGDYPQVMKELAGNRLPRFTEEESRDLKGSIDFIGLNYYFALWATKAKPSEDPPADLKTWLKESQSEFYWKDADGKILGDPTGPSTQTMFRSCPWGLRKVLAGLGSRYGKIPIYITENGTVDPDTTSMLGGPLNDQHRIKFLQDHVSEISDSIRVDKMNVKGYFHWTLMDNWEWMSGFTLRFGLYYVDFNHPQLPRQPKASAKWLSSFLKS